MPDLDTRLARSRAALLDDIEQPPLADVRRRATRIRRTRAVRAGAAALALLGVIAVGARPWQHDADPTVTASPPVDTPIYRGDGIEIIGLSPSPLFELPGEIGDVEFGDSVHGVLAAGCDRSCPPLASTSDGGLSWRTVPGSPTGDGLPDVVAFPDGRWLMVRPSGLWSSATGTRWLAVEPRTPTTRERIGAGELPRLDEATGRVAVWSPDHGPLGPLARQPQLTARWVAPAPAGDGAWWVGGVAGSGPAVAVSRDSGDTWTTTPLPAPAGAVSTVTLGTLGTEVYAVAQGEKGELRAIYHSTDGGTSFAPTYSGTDKAAVQAAIGDGKAPEFVSGDPVPLLDGRLLLVQPGNRSPGSWWLSEDGGRTFSAPRGLPAAGSVRRTYVGYVAYRLFENAWAAYSTDGSHWQKLQIF